MTNPLETPLDIYRWTVEDYHRLVESGILDEDFPVELLHGQILKMSPAGVSHAACIDRLNELFRDILGKSVIVRVQNPVILDDFSEPEPDVAILRRKNNFYADGHPRPNDVLLIVEVADTTLHKDRSAKKEAYAAAAIPEYWIVNLPEQQIEQYLAPSGSDYQLTHIYKTGQAITSELTDTVQVKDILV